MILKIAASRFIVLFRPVVWGAFILVMHGQANALEPLSETELSQTAGRDGLTVTLNSPPGGLSADSLELSHDELDANNAASLLLGNLNLDLGSGMVYTLDVGSTGTDEPLVLITGSWSDLVARIGSISHSAEPTNTMGILGLESTGSFSLENQNGLFNSQESNADFQLNSLGNLFWRQRNLPNASELSLADLDFSLGFNNGTVGVDSQGLIMAADQATMNLTFDLALAVSTNSLFDKVSRNPLVYTGWSGGLRNFEFRFAGGGVGYGTYQSAGNEYHDVAGLQSLRSEGFHTSFQSDFDTDFKWVIGQTFGERARAEFSNWQRLGASNGFVSGDRQALSGVSMAPYDFRLPLIFDAINAAGSPGGICFGGALPVTGSLTAASCGSLGGEYKDIAPTDNTLAMLIRDGGLHAYNTQVSIWERDWDTGTLSWGDHVQTDVFDWSLLYTLGKIDANIFMHPAASSADEAFRADVLLAIQSPGYWDAAQSNFTTVSAGNDPRDRWATNTHFMIADTNSGGDALGIGLVNADLFWRVQDFAVQLFDQALADGYDAYDASTNPDGIRHPMAPGVWLETDRRSAGPGSIAAKYQFRGLFGGGDLQSLGDPIRGLLIDINLETDRFVFVIGDNEGVNAFPFEGLFEFNGNAYISLAEPSVPTAAYRIHNVSGAIQWKNGEITLSSSNDTGGRPELRITNDILLGDTAVGGAILRGDISLGANDTFGSIVIPSGAVHSSIALKPQ